MVENDTASSRKPTGGYDPDGKKSPEKHALPRIRTYAADMSRVIEKRGETLSSIVTAEKRRPVEDNAEAGRHPNRRFVFIGGAILLVLLGIGTIAGVSFSLIRQNQPPDSTESIIFANRNLNIEDAPDGRAALARVRAETDLSLGEVARVAILTGGAELAPQEMARALGLSDALAREVTEVMVGIHAFDRNQPFILFRISAFDRALGALLSQEKTLGADLGPFFAPRGATESAPSALSFTDAVVRNIDVRRSGSAWPILYAFPARTLLVITTNEFTLREVMSRLGNAQ